MKKLLNDNKGFTLIELLAVIVILAVLMLVAGSNVFTIITDARRGTFRTEFISLINTASTKAQLDIMNGKLQGKATACYKISDITQWDNKNGYVGSVYVEKSADGKLTFTGWMSSSEFLIEAKSSGLDNSATDIPAANGVKASENCAGKPVSK